MSLDEHESEGGSPQEPERIVLPSWIDDAIARSRSDDPEGEEPLTGEARSYPTYGSGALDADAYGEEDEPYASAEGTAEAEAESAAGEAEPFAPRPFQPFALRESPSYGTEESEPYGAEDDPFDASSERTGSFEEHDTAGTSRPTGDSVAPISFLSARLAQAGGTAPPAARAEPAPLPPPAPLRLPPIESAPQQEEGAIEFGKLRRPPNSAPWLFAAIFFAVAALMLALLMILKPAQG